MRSFSLRPRIYFGSDALDALRQLAGKRVLVVTDGFLARSGLLDQVKARLGDGMTVFDQVEPDPPLALAAKGVLALEKAAPEVVVAFGGGSPMDCAKAIRYFSKRELPLWAVPTTAGTGSEVTSFAVLTHDGVKYPIVDDALLPDAAVLDPTLLAGVPAAVTADTGMDVLAHATEGYVARKANPFTDALAEHAFTLAWESLPRAVEGDMAAREQMLLASCLAGMAFNGAGLGICHGLSHALGGQIHLPHGRLNAILLPHVLRFNSADGAAAKKYGRLAALCGRGATAQSLASGLARLRAALGLPDRLGGGVDVPAAAAAALADRCTPENPRQAAVSDLSRLLREAGA